MNGSSDAGLDEKRNTQAGMYRDDIFPPFLSGNEKPSGRELTAAERNYAAESIFIFLLPCLSTTDKM